MRPQDGLFAVGRSLLVSSPRAHAFGLLVADTCVSAAVAEARSARLLWAAPEPVQARLLRALRFHGRSGTFGRCVLAGGVGRRVRDAARSVGSPAVESVDVRRAFAHGHVRARLDAASDERARLRLAALGLDTDRPFVAVHIRVYPSSGEPQYRSFIRGADPATYEACIRRLAQLGYQTVQVGREAASTPLPVTVAVPPDDPEALLMQLSCIANAAFFLASDSGPYQLSWLLGAPCLHTNVVNLLGAFPLRTFDRYLPKRIADREIGRELGLEQVAADEFWLGMTRNVRAKRFVYLDASPQHLADAAEDMLADLHDPPPPTPAQEWFRERVASLLLSPPMLAKIHSKTALPEAFVGEGRISRRFVEAHRYAPADG